MNSVRVRVVPLHSAVTGKYSLLLYFDSTVTKIKILSTRKTVNNMASSIKALTGMSLKKTV